MADCDERLRASGIQLVESLSGRMLDPHLYFRAHYTGLIRQASDADALSAILRELIDWTETADLADVDMDAGLREAGLLTIQEIRARL